jgi:uncharacterized radical SAM superfamily Fe-S cluster-containing enzyme
VLELPPFFRTKNISNKGGKDAFISFKIYCGYGTFVYVDDLVDSCCKYIPLLYFYCYEKTAELMTEKNDEEKRREGEKRMDWMADLKSLRGALAIASVC